MKSIFIILAIWGATFLLIKLMGGKNSGGGCNLNGINGNCDLWFHLNEKMFNVYWARKYKSETEIYDKYIKEKDYDMLILGSEERLKLIVNKKHNYSEETLKEIQSKLAQNKDSVRYSVSEYDDVEFLLKFYLSEREKNKQGN